MPSWVFYTPAGLLAGLQILFGASELFAPRSVCDMVLPAYYDTRTNPVWNETEKVVRNIGLYNWFLALGLLLALFGHLGGLPTSQFFLACVAAAGLFGLLSVGGSGAFIAQLVLGLVSLILSVVIEFH